MLRVTTLHASSATATAAYYARYLTAAPGEAPGLWSGRQAAGLGLAGTVGVEELELLLSGRDPMSGMPLGRELLDRFTADGRVIKAVSGFDATFSAPKSVSVWWALTGDHRLLEAHDVAVTAALAHLERFGSTTRIRSEGGRLHPDTKGLTIATFRQTTSRADDPQIHTHAVISAKVQIAEGRWLALDARYLKKHQRMLGGVYQSVLRAELTHRLGVEWTSIVTGQAEIVGVPDELLDVFSKRSATISVAMVDKLAEFRQREGREPSRFERAALERQASADTRSRKSGDGAADLATRWRTEAAEVGWTVDQLNDAIEQSTRNPTPADVLTVDDVVKTVSATQSSWGRPEVIKAICDRQRPMSEMPGHRWADLIERSADRVVGHLVDLDPPAHRRLRGSDGRSVWIEPTAPRFTSDEVLAQEEHIITWAIAAQAEEPAPSTTASQAGLDVAQADAAASAAGGDDLVLVVGPAGTGKTRMLAAASNDLTGHGGVVFGLAPSAKAARVLERDTHMPSDTVAKLLHEWRRPDRPPAPAYRLAAGATIFIDEASMLSTPDLYQLVRLAETQRWRLVLVGDHRQLQAVGRGGLFAELCLNGRVEELEQLHRFTHRWEAVASLRLRSGDARALDAYETRGRIVAGTLDQHVERMAQSWIDDDRRGDSVALVASTNDHVDAINRHVQAARLARYDIDPHWQTAIAGGEVAHGGDVIVTRRNDRHLLSDLGQPVRNRETWTVDQVHRNGSLTVSQRHGRGTVNLPADYAQQHVRLGYAATEHGYQSDTVTTGIALAGATTTRRGLYVAATRGRDSNLLCVVTDSDDVADARDVLEAVLALDRADVPAVAQRRMLVEQDRHARPPGPVEPVRLPRCSIPEWLPPLLDAARCDLDAAERQLARREAIRDQCVADVGSAQARLRHVDERTRPARQERLDASSQVTQAQRRRDDATRRLESSGLRGRRQARLELAVAEDRLDQATNRYEGVERRTAPAVASHHAANDALSHAADAVRHHDLIDQLDRRHDLAANAHERIGALETWRTWANGEPIDISDLAAALPTLTDPQLHAAAPGYRTLGDTITRWATNTGLQQQLIQHQPPGLELTLGAQTSRALDSTLE